MKQKNFLKIAAILILFLNFQLSYGQSVVINEVIASPRHDFSSTSFNSTPTTAFGQSSNDEWIELYIKTPGLNLTGWTIELNDSSPVTGDLTATGAFDVSNYISSGAGTFTNTEVGDFLVLGNVDGSGGINNNITINLKNSDGTTIDTISLGTSGSGPSGSSSTSSVGDESVHRMPNGADTGDDALDFNKGVSSIGKLNPTQRSWDGSANNDWTNASNWGGGNAPTASENVFIPKFVANSPTIETAVVVSSINIESGASLVTKDATSIAANVTYNRNIDFIAGNLKGWYLVSSPVSSQAYNNSYATTNDLATSGTKRGLATYRSGPNDFVYLLTDDSNSGTFIDGKGYSIKKGTATGNVSFTGTLNTNNAGVDFSLDTDASRFNLLGNPYTASIDATTFLNAETSISDTKTIWVWNQTLSTDGQYEVQGTLDDFKIAPAQGFFVKANAAGGTFNFSEANQTHNADTFQKNVGKTEIKLWITDGIIKNYARVQYLEDAITGFKAGYDGELFTGKSNDFAIYSQLIDDNEGKNYQLQSLPNMDYETMIVPVGLNADTGKEITFTADVDNLPNGLHVFLEDRLKNTFTQLDGTNSSYTITLTEKSDNVGRFYLHTNSSSVLSTNIDILESIAIFKSDNTTLKIAGLAKGDANVKIFNMLGKQVMNTSFKANLSLSLTLPKLAKGLYLVQLTAETGKLNKKIILE